MKKKIQLFETIKKLSSGFAESIAEDIASIPDGKFYSIALSGGSTPRTIFKFISENYRDKIDWSKVLIFWGDERCVPPESNESNYKMAFENLLKDISIPEYNIYRIKGEDDPTSEEKRYSELVDYLLPHMNHIPQFDLIMLGLGEDGHTASIFPDQLALLNSEKFFEASKHPVSGQNRITATGKLINNSRKVCFLITGENKADRVVQIIEKKEGWELLPASFIHPKEGELIWMLDEPAGRKLSDGTID